MSKIPSTVRFVLFTMFVCAIACGPCAFGEADAIDSENW